MQQHDSFFLGFIIWWSHNSSKYYLV